MRVTDDMIDSLVCPPPPTDPPVMSEEMISGLIVPAPGWSKYDNNNNSINNTVISIYQYIYICILYSYTMYHVLGVECRVSSEENDDEGIVNHLGVCYITYPRRHILFQYPYPLAASFSSPPFDVMLIDIRNILNLTSV